MENLPVVDVAGTGQKIQKIRIENGYTVKDLQRIFGFESPQAIYKWQHGQSLPTVDNLVVLASVFHVSIDEIIEVKSNVS